MQVSSVSVGFRGKPKMKSSGLLRCLPWLGVALCLVGCRPEYTASADIAGGAAVTMTVRGMFSMQSDWMRSLRVEQNGESVSIDLGADTGWWRGSNLYRSQRGVYVLDEGQAGCKAFMIDPPRFLVSAGALCDRSPGVPIAEPKSDSTRSKIYPALEYLGRFVEARNGTRGVRFLTAVKEAERLLPPPI